MALYDRIIGRSDAGGGVDFKIGVHAFSALLAEFARGRLTGAQAQAGVTLVSGAPLDPDEVTEINALLATVAGSTTAKLARAKEIDDVITLAEFGVVQYDTPTKVKTRLGV